MSAVDYFILEDGSNVQIKAWGQSGVLFRIGDEVRPLWGKASYYILVREGHAIRVENCKIHSVVDAHNRDSSLDSFDHFGQPYNRNTVGLLGEPYFWKDYHEWREKSHPVVVTPLFKEPGNA